jgi:hypothetical protein
MSDDLFNVVSRNLGASMSVGGDSVAAVQSEVERRILRQLKRVGVQPEHVELTSAVHDSLTVTVKVPEPLRDPDSMGFLCGRCGAPHKDEAYLCDDCSNLLAVERAVDDERQRADIEQGILEVDVEVPVARRWSEVQT